MERIFSQGKDSTISYFFTPKGVCLKYISDPELHFLIKAMYKWCYLIFQDDESGYFFYITIEEMQDRMANMPKIKE